jgi:hypothetical protein
MMTEQQPCLAGHRWQRWSWRRVQFPNHGRPLESVWVRACETCRSSEVRCTRPTQRPLDDDAEVRGVLAV